MAASARLPAACLFIIEMQTKQRRSIFLSQQRLCTIGLSSGVKYTVFPVAKGYRGSQQREAQIAPKGRLTWLALQAHEEGI